MTIEQAKSELMQIYGALSPNKQRAIDTVLHIIEQEPCRDMEEIREVMSCDADLETKCKMVSNILTAKPHYFKMPQPKTGHWILKRLSPTRICGEHLKEYECSECYRGIRCTESQLVNYPYCHCGAKMESEDKE